MAKYVQPAKTSEKVIEFGNLKGADFFNESGSVNNSHSPNLLNFISGPSGHPVKRFGYEKILTVPGQFNGEYELKTATATYCLIHAGTTLYLWNTTTNALTSLYTGMANARSRAFAMNTRLWIQDGQKYLVFGEFASAFVAKTVESIAYVPRTFIARAPTGGGTRKDYLNLLQSQHTVSFAGTAAAVTYTLDGDTLTSIDLVETLNSSGTWVVVATSAYTKNLVAGQITFGTAPGVSPLTGEDNIRVTLTKDVAGYKDRINHCTIAVLYGVGNHDRAFMSGNDNMPNADFVTEVGDPTYLPDTGYALAGQDNTKVQGYLKVGEYLTIVKESNAQDATAFLRTGSVDSSGIATFALKQGIGTGTGAVSRYAFASLLNDPLFLSKEGAVSIVTDAISAEKNVRHRSSKIDPLLTREAGLDEAVMIVHKGYLYLCVNSRCYVADSAQRTSTDVDDFEYEWYYWNNIPARQFFVHDDDLYFGTVDGDIMRFYKNVAYGNYNDNGVAIEAIWDTPEVDLGTYLRSKTATRFAVRMAAYSRSSLDLYVKDDGVFELVDTERLDSFGFNAFSFAKFSFVSASGSRILNFKNKVKGMGTTQIRLQNKVLDEPFGILGCSMRFEVKGDLK